MAGLPTPGMMPPPQAGGGANLGLSGLKGMMPQMMAFLAGLGFPELVGNVAKLQKTMMGGAQGQKPGHQPVPGQPGAPGMAGAAPPSPPGAMGISPQTLMALSQLLQARQGGMGM